MPPELAGVPWSQLKLADVDAFLAQEPEETLLWEAKSDGRERLGTHVIAKAVCGFANSERGGYLFIGAQRSGSAYELVGLSQPPAADLGAWVDQVIRGGAVKPLPWFEPRAFTKRRGAVVVAIDPVEQPPCITSGGAVYERTSGRTVPVTDPGELARLFAVGKAARRRRVILQLDDLIMEANAMREALFEDPPRPGSVDEANAVLADWASRAVAAFDAELPGRRGGFLAKGGSSGQYVGPIWRSNATKWLDLHIDRLVGFQQELARP